MTVHTVTFTHPLCHIKLFRIQMVQPDMMIELVIIHPITYNAAPFLITPEATPFSTLLGIWKGVNQRLTPFQIHLDLVFKITFWYNELGKSSLHGHW